MNKLTKFVVSISVSGLLLTSLAATSFASDSTIHGNGDQSTNTIVVQDNCSNTVNQTSNTAVEADVVAGSSSGGNTVSGNTGAGDTTINTGDAKTTVNVSVTGGSNTSSLPDCCCNQNALDQTVSGNGTKSENTVVVTSSSKSKLTQTTNTVLSLGVLSLSKTGKNRVKNNTGKGDTTLTSGDSTTTVGVTVKGGSNL